MRPIDSLTKSQCVMAGVLIGLIATFLSLTPVMLLLANGPTPCCCVGGVQ